MQPKLIAAILAAAALPAIAQAATPSADPRPSATVQAKEGPPQSRSALSPRERAKAAKAQQKKNRQLARQKQEPQKKAPAT